MAVIAGVLGRAGQRGQKRRLDSASKGFTTWLNPPEIHKFLQKEKGRGAAEEEELKQAGMGGEGAEERKQDPVSKAELDAFAYFQKERDQGAKPAQ